MKEAHAGPPCDVMCCGAFFAPCFPSSMQSMFPLLRDADLIILHLDLNYAFACFALRE